MVQEEVSGKEQEGCNKLWDDSQNSQLPKGERAKQKGQLGVRNEDIFRDPRYFPRALDQQSMWYGDHKGMVQPTRDRVL